MATILNTTQVYAAADVVTHTNLNQIVSGTTFVAGDGGATDNTSLEVDTTSGSLQIKDDGVTTAKLLNSTDKTDGVTLPKIQHIDTAKVLGRTSTGEGNVEEVDVVIGATGDSGVFFDNDDMLDNNDTAGGSATRGATQQSIKAYVDEYALKYSGVEGQLEVSGFSTYRDLDLSSVVGANRALVIMQVFGGNNSTNTYFRTKGISIKPFGSSNNSGFGASGGVVGPATDGDGYTCVVITDENGVLEYSGGNNTATGIKYRIQAYQKLR